METGKLPEMLTVDEISGLLRISKTKAYELVNSNSFPIVRIGTIIRIPKDTLISWIYSSPSVC